MSTDLSDMLFTVLLLVYIQNAGEIVPILNNIMTTIIFFPISKNMMHINVHDNISC